ncbi:MAG: zf-TFIIB domain-containing protein [Alphaproteobacteria bacterium]|nr:zf-TFIIB domain-containing protein [Alphaproteobacteria bacterium]
MDCPACGYELASRRADQVDHQVCELCGGIWVDTLKSLQLWATFHAQREPLPAHPPEGVPTRAEGCPQCQRPLESFAYMEDRTVQVQRCNTCSKLFVPGDQQEQARALWAKRVGREAVRLERKADVAAAYRPQKTVIRGGRGAHGTRHGRRTYTGSDVAANMDLLFNERERERNDE